MNPKVDPAKATGVAHIYYLYKRNEETEEAWSSWDVLQRDPEGHQEGISINRLIGVRC